MTIDPSRTILKKNIKIFIYFEANVHSTHTQKCLRGSKVEGNKKKTSNLIIQNVESENF